MVALCCVTRMQKKSAQGITSHTVHQIIYHPPFIINNMSNFIEMTFNSSEMSPDDTPISTDENVRLLRDEDELEGALLPVATVVPLDEHHQQTTHSSSMLAVPMETFDYETALVAEQQQQERVAYSIPPSSTAAGSSDAVADDSKQRIQQAARLGLLASEEEKDAIRKANRNVFSKDYFSQLEVNAANHHARMREWEQVLENSVIGASHMNHMDLSKGQSTTSTSTTDDITTATNATNDTTNNNNNPNNNNTNKQSGGYQVGEYECQEYQVGSYYGTKEYETKEYKSVYD